jgi:uncharacterized spore protein YtfJ
MDGVKRILDVVRGRLSRAALKDVVVSKPISVAERHVLVLSEVSYGFGAGGGSGDEKGKRASRGSGAGGGGGAKASPVAVLVVDGGKVRLEKLGN